MQFYTHIEIFHGEASLVKIFSDNEIKKIMLFFIYRLLVTYSSVKKKKRHLFSIPVTSLLIHSKHKQQSIFLKQFDAYAI